MTQDQSGEIRILLIDDEATIRNFLRPSFESQEMKVAEAETGKAGLEKAAQFHPHLIVLDLGLPDLNGFEVLKELRKWTRVPVIVLTVDDDEGTKVRLLDAGADDYITKPFGLPELLARVRVSLRNRLVEATPIFRSGDLEVDVNSRVTKVGGRMVKLTATEFEVLARLVRDQGKVVPQRQLMVQIWGITAEDKTHFLRIYINQIRKKIEADPSKPVHIITEPGVGYRLL